MMLLDFQKTILSASPALLPLLTFPLSFIQSWHCSMMCGPIYLTKTPVQRNRYLQGRFLSYTAAGAVFGALGETLHRFLEVEILGGLAFVIFFALTVGLALKWFGTSIRLWKMPSLPKAMIERWGGKSSFVHGLFSVALPCGLLYQVFGLSALSNSMIAGLLIGSAHATATTPSFWLGTKALQLFKSFGKRTKVSIQVFLLALLIFNLFYFAGRLLYKEDVAQSKILFCL